MDKKWIIRGVAISPVTVFGIVVAAILVAAGTLVVVSPIAERDLNIGPAASPPPTQDQSMFTNVGIQVDTAKNLTYSPTYGTEYSDTGVAATNMTANTVYFYKFSATPTAAARAALNVSGSDGWVWYIEIDAPNIKATDVTADYLTAGAVPYQQTPVSWNTSEPGRLVGFGYIEPVRGLASGPPPSTFAANYTHAGMDGTIVFYTPGEYTMKAYLVNANYNGQFLEPIGVPPIDAATMSGDATTMMATA